MSRYSSLLLVSASDVEEEGAINTRLLELAAATKSTFEPVIQVHLYPRSTIDIFIHVLQLDWGLLTACIIGSTLALATAGIPLFDFVCA
ncbi:hypothetical protein AZE42_09555, partial [Rhizopogon vesiculosus]